jgi:hypothetical protein
VIFANLAMVALVATSFATCSSHAFVDPLKETTAQAAAVASVLLCIALVAWALVVTAREQRERRSLAHTVSRIVTVLVGVAAGSLATIFWLTAAMKPLAISFGGWGRPLRIGGRQVTPGIRASRDWARGPRPRVDALTPEARALLRDLWLHDARKEHASVPAFGQVAWQLVALGAPADLLRRAHTSCLQEIDHAERCFALASSYAGEDLGVQAMPALSHGSALLPRDTTRALVQVATEALVDGALLEDFNAELAATALADVVDVAAREALVRIVADEREHAAFAWDVVAFCIERGGAPVVDALRATLAKLPAAPSSLYDPALAERVVAFDDPAVLAAHGRVRGEVIEGVYRERMAACAAHLATLTDAAPSARAA